MSNSEITNSACYSIGKVSAVTGINTVTLRAWERRYGIVSPQRSDSGRRLYSEADVQRIREVQRLLQEGVSIGQASSRMRPAGSSDTDGYPGNEPWEAFMGRIIGAIEAFDEVRLEAAYNEVLSLYPREMVVRHLLLPLLRRLGERWQDREGGVAEEHFFAVYLRNKIGARFHHRAPHGDGPVLVAACLPGEHHEIGLLLFSLAAHERGFRVILLGADMPLRELPVVARRSCADAVVLAGSITPPPELFEDDMRDLVSTLRIPVFIGGSTACDCRAAVEDAGAVPVGDDLALGVGRISGHPDLSDKL